MTTLFHITHLLTDTALQSLATQLGPNDEVLLAQDGIYNQLALKQQVHYLAEDATARGVSNRLVNETAINYEQFVELTLKHSRIIKWV